MFNIGHLSFTNHRRQILITLITSLGFFGAGNIIGWTSTGLPSLAESPEFKNLTSVDTAWIASLVPLGALVSTPFAGLSMNYFGRKTTMTISVVVQVLGWIIMLSATQVPMLFISRFISGLSLGGISMSVPVYINDIADKEIRGTLCSFGQIMITFGTLFSYVIGTIVSWQYTVLISTAAPLIQLLFSDFLPESHRYYLCNGKIDDAVLVARWLRQNNTEEEVNEEIMAIMENLDEIESQKESDSYTICSRSTLLPLLSTCLLMIIQQLSGTNALIFYSVNVFESAGVQRINAKFCTMLVGLIQFIMTIVECMLIDITGRRTLLIISGVSMIFTQVITGILFMIKLPNGQFSSIVSIILTITLLLSIIAVTIGFGAIPFVMMSELLPNHAIGMTSAITISSFFAFEFLLIFVFQGSVEFFGNSIVFIFFGVMCLFGTLFVYFAIPETKQKTFEEIQLHYISKNPNVRKNSRYQTFDSPPRKTL